MSRRKKLPGLDTQADILIRDFPFDEVIRVMTVTGWRYHGSEDYPTKQKLCDCIRRLLQDMGSDHRIKEASSGGFTLARDQRNQLVIKFTWEVCRSYADVEDN